MLSGSALTEYLVTIPDAIGGSQVVTIGIDGPDCSGKTTLAKALAATAPARWRSLHLDEYVDPRVLQLDHEIMSLETFLTDYFPPKPMAEAIREGADTCRTQGIGNLVVEGLFLCRPQICRLLDYILRLEISESLVLKRALARDVGVLGSREWVRRHYVEQCLPAQRVYRAIVQPEMIANDIAVFLEESDAWDLRRL
jgi:uridine kinase